MLKTAFTLSVIGLLMIPVAASAAKCDAKTMDGQWQRIGKGGVAMNAVWQFQPDLSVSCDGDCARLAGLPLSYTVSRSKVSLQFEKGSMPTARCRVRNGVMTFAGGTDQGGFTFKRID